MLFILTIHDTFYEFEKIQQMPFKFVNWFLEQTRRNGDYGGLAKRCLADENFPIHAKHFDEVLGYFIEKKASKDEIKIINDAWNEYRTLKKVRVTPLNMLKSSMYRF